MQNDAFWSTVYLVGLAGSFAIRWSATRGAGLPSKAAGNATSTATHSANSDTHAVVRHQADPLAVTLGQLLWTLAQVGVCVRMRSTWVAFAEYPTSIAWRTLGLTLLIGSLLLLWHAHRELGANWDRRLVTHTGQELITTGVYRWIRHPLYAAYLLSSVAACLLIPNVMIGMMAVGGMGLVYLGRLAAEERMLREQFGHDYAKYAAKTNRLVPRLCHIHIFFRRR